MKSFAALVFPGFQTLDLFGPLEMFGDGSLRSKIDVTIVAESLQPVPSIHGHGLTVDRTLDDGTDYDMVFVPGGDTALEAAQRQPVIDWLTAAAANAEIAMTVCTGSILLASTGLLDGKSATTNKQDFVATTPLAPHVNWIRQARWVEDGRFFTSSGVSAGMDMALAAIARLYGRAIADDIAIGSEYTWHDNPDWDPFAAEAGLI